MCRSKMLLYRIHQIYDVGREGNRNLNVCKLCNRSCIIVLHCLSESCPEGVSSLLIKRRIENPTNQTEIHLKHTTIPKEDAYSLPRKLSIHKAHRKLREMAQETSPVSAYTKARSFQQKESKNSHNEALQLPVGRAKKMLVSASKRSTQAGQQILAQEEQQSCKLGSITSHKTDGW